MGEEWRPVPVDYFCEYYEVSNLGSLRNTKTKKLLAGGLTRGYRINILSHDNHRLMVQRHRMVAGAFLSNGSKLPCVNHKDENKDNNVVDNLEWCSWGYNNTYGTRLSRVKTAVAKRVVVTYLPTKHSYFFNSLTDACTLLGTDPSNSSKCARGNNNYTHVGNFVFNYHD